MPPSNDAVQKAAKATERAHVACARLDRSAFRTQTIDPTPEVWYLHNTTNEAFKALVRSRSAYKEYVQASLRGDEDEAARYNKMVESEADLASYLAETVEELIQKRYKQWG